MKSVENTIPIDTFIALNGDLKTLSPHNFIVNSNLDLSVSNQNNLPILSVELSIVRTDYNSFQKKEEKTQLYIVKYLKNGVETIKQCAGLYIDIKCEMILHHSFTK